MAKNLHNNKFDSLQFKKSELKAKQIGKMYTDLLQQILSGFRIVDVKPNQFFAFDDYAQYKDKMNTLFEKFSLNVTTEINKQSKEAWEYADKKNQSLLKETMKKFGITNLNLRDNYSKANLEALAAFQKRKAGGMNLSQRVWKQTQQFKKEIELGLDIGLRDGKSAVDIARDVKQYLNQPDKLFRRVRDHHGNLGLSKAAKAYNPGAGVYRSSMKNAMRLSRTENNMAYHESNYDKYNQFDFIIGIRIKLSNNAHHCPFCESMQGDYPKEYKFLGWHPQCRCTTVPILKSRSEMQKDNVRLIQGKQPERSQNEVLNVPKHYKEYIDKNQTKLEAMSSKPYWYKDNSKLESKEPVKITPIKKVKTQYEKDLIQSNWDKRNEIHTQIKTNAKDLIADYDKWKGDVDPPNLTALKTMLEKNQLYSIKDKTQLFKYDIEALKIEKVKEWEKYVSDMNPFVNKFQPSQIDEAMDAVQKKLDWLDNMKGNAPLEEYMEFYNKKLKFEIEWLADKQPYSTWEIAQKAYKENLFQNNYQTLKTKLEDSVSFLGKELKKNPTKKGQGFLDDILKAHTEALKISELGNLEEAIQNAEQYIQLRQSKIKLTEVKTTKVISEGAYSQARRDAAFITGDAQAIDDLFREALGEKWIQMDNQTKIALYEYTAGSGKFNRPLRGFDRNWQNSKGIGNVPLGNEGSMMDYIHLANKEFEMLDMTKATERMAKEIEKNHKLPMDLWLRRGDAAEGFNGLFGTDIRSIMDNPDELKKLIGKKAVDQAFLSTSPAAASNMGFSGMIDYKIYAPKGTQAIYAEPFSEYGKSTKNKWNGKSKQKTFGHEFEVIVNQGYEYQIVDIKRDSKTGKVNVIMQILTRDKRYKYF